MNKAIFVIGFVFFLVGVSLFFYTTTESWSEIDYVGTVYFVNGEYYGDEEGFLVDENGEVVLQAEYERWMNSSFVSESILKEYGDDEVFLVNEEGQIVILDEYLRFYADYIPEGDWKRYGNGGGFLVHVSGKILPKSEWERYENAVYILKSEWERYGITSELRGYGIIRHSVSYEPFRLYGAICLIMGSAVSLISFFVPSKT